jgi:hypothetical protein
VVVGVEAFHFQKVEEEVVEGEVLLPLEGVVEVEVVVLTKQVFRCLR